MIRRLVLPAIAATLALTALACEDDGGGSDTTDTGAATDEAETTGAPAEPIVFNGEGNNLNAYDSQPPFEKQTVITNAEDDPDGLDINAQICFFPDGSNRFIAGEDTGQPDPPQGWGIFQLSGDAIGDFSATQIGKLTPTYQDTLDTAENYGCGFLSDGRILTTDIGNQASGPDSGQLIVWFPPDFGNASESESNDVPYCKLDTAIGTAGQIYVDDQDNVYVASARGATLGVLRFSGPFPTSDDAAGGCGQTDATGAPLADSVNVEQFIMANEDVATPNAIVPAPDGGFYVSSVINGRIGEFDADGNFVRLVLEPPADEELGEESFSTGTPLGLGIDSSGTLYYADIGITITDEGIGPGAEGSVRRIVFENGEPQPPEVVGDGLAFPDGIGILE
jgi:sugar lactone lactonase YvrE